MYTTVTVLVRLKIPDVIAATALQAVRTLLDRPGVSRLLRADVFQVTVDAPSADDGLALVRRMVEQTACFMNPNKHTVEYRQQPLQACYTQQPQGQACIYVRQRDDAKAAMLHAALRDDPRFGSAIVRLERGVLWTLDCPEGAHETAQSLAITTHRTRGLFANPHAEEAFVY